MNTRAVSWLRMQTPLFLGDQTVVSLGQGSLLSGSDCPLPFSCLPSILSSFFKAVIVVSHDARLITETNCQLWVVEEQSVSQIDGDFEDYKREVLEALGEVMVNRPRE